MTTPAGLAIQLSQTGFHALLASQIAVNISQRPHRERAERGRTAIWQITEMAN